MLFVVWMSFNDRCKSLDFSAVLLLVLRYFSPVLSPLNFHRKWTVGFKSLHQVWSRYETRTKLEMIKDLKELAHMVFLCVIFVLILSSLFFVPWVKHLYVGQFWRCHSRISRLVNLVSWIIALGRVYIYIHTYISTVIFDIYRSSAFLVDLRNLYINFHKTRSLTLVKYSPSFSLALNPQRPWTNPGGYRRPSHQRDFNRIRNSIKICRAQV